MILEDKYRLKDRGSYRNYKDEVLDFITVFADYFLSVYETEFDKRNLNQYVRIHMAIQKGLSVLQRPRTGCRDRRPGRRRLRGRP